jgi:hypothetical protein
VIAVGAAAHKLSRLISKAAVTSPVRAPFTDYREPAGSSEVNEAPRGSGLQHVVGELISCPFCLDVWSATALTLSMVVAPGPVRAAVAILDSVAVADVLQFAYTAAEQATD